MEILGWVASACYLLLLVTTLVIILTDRSNYNPSKAIAWLVLIMFLPILGILLYFIFGFDRRRIGATEKDRQKFMQEFVPKLPPEVSSFLQTPHYYLNRIDPSHRPLARLLERNNYSRILYGSEVEIITDGSQKLERLIEDMEQARSHIHCEFFLFHKDKTSRRIREVLMHKAEEGVEVRFVYDNIANINIPIWYYTKMRKSGVQVKLFTRLSLSSIRRSLNNRNHRKIVVIDGKVGYVGGMNITSQTLRWRDAHLRIKGQGVHGLQINFLQSWYNSGGSLGNEVAPYFPIAPIFTQNLMQIVPEAPDTRFPYYALSVVKVIENAKKYIYIQTPYFMPTESVMRSLKSAALSGVEVRIMVSRKSDFVFMDWAIQANYEKTLEAGIHIHEIQNYFSHAKSMVVDDYLSIIGSSNLDYRSLELNFEINSFMYDEKIAVQNREIFLKDMEDCVELSLDEWRKRPWWRKILQIIMRFFSPLL